MDRRRFFMSTSSLVAAAHCLPFLASASTKDFGQSRGELFAGVDAAKNNTLTRIAFGSCNKQTSSQKHWDIIGEEKPDLWLWLGDNIYADQTTITERASQYQILKDNPYYQEFRLNTPIMGTWDDHDYAADNQGIEFRDKDASQQLFMDFLDLPNNHLMRKQRGVYWSETFGPIGRQVQIIMLDLRYFRKRQATAGGGSLGEMQWLWLEDQIRTSTADVIILGSSLHLTSGYTGFGLEGWNEFPADRRRLYDLLSETSTPTLVLSGDRHMAEFTKTTLDNGKVIYEFMSSGMTHSARFPFPDPNRIGSLIGERNFGMIYLDWSGVRPDIRLEIKSTVRPETYARLTPNFASVRDSIYTASL
jgi:alkaline phosphatase D